MKRRYRSLWGDWLFGWIAVLVAAAGVFTVYDAFDGALDEAWRRRWDFLVGWAVNAVLFVIALAGIPLWWRWRRRTVDGPRSGDRRPRR